jgi:hypothetical protein
MKSDGQDWRCTDEGCGIYVKKVSKNLSIQKFNNSLGFNPKPAEDHAVKCAQSERLIITCAVNNAPAHVKSLRSLQQYSEHLNCPIAVIPAHYINKNVFNVGDEKEYDELLHPYLVKGEFLFGNVLVHSDVRINPTAVNPLSGLQSHGGRKWGLYGHCQLAREPQPTPGNQFPKLNLTTGAITEPSYTVSKAGNSGRFNHCMSALILEKYDETFTFVRQLQFDEKGWFYDLDLRVTPNGVTEGNRVKAIIPGDEHVKFNSCEAIIYADRS